MKPLFFLLGSILPLAAASDAWLDAYSLETIPNPPGVDPQIGGLASLPDGRIAACFHRGEVMIYDPVKKAWSLFASGLHEPLGLVAESASQFVVMQRAELTRLTDSDGDGQADRYDTVFDGFGMTGNYHEFAFGPALGPDGSYYIGLNLASNGASIRPEIRGPWSPVGDLTQAQMASAAEWKKYSGKAGRMYSRVEWRGWILRVSPDGKTMTPFASGFRSPDGVGFDAEGRLLVTDNQGDWRGSSPLHHVVEGGFYGHPASLVWRPGWDKGDPLKLPVAELEKLRSPETAVFPQGELGNSPTQPIAIPAGTWGSLAGQTLIGEMNHSRLVRFLGETVDGVYQGALIPFFDTKKLGNGNHRLAFGKDGALWVGKTHLSWAGGTGLSRIVPTGKEFLAIQTFKAEKDSFRINFNRPVDPATLPQKFEASHFYYSYHSTYGSPKREETKLTVSPVLSADGLTLILKTGPQQKGRLYSFDLQGISAPGAGPLLGEKVYYQMSKVPR